ncbi:uncharacterized protein LOC142578067 [Dermacentor variabilis]|uniref:uncharacterized protein LOC142578067 n=1 Tax=Dermacentor variabilis TaxID=34621 RepID=UPI003F5BB2F2
MLHFEFLVLLGLFIGAQAVTLDDLRAALNTAEKTWLTERTYNLKGHSCVYTLKEELTQEKYTFRQYYKKDGEEVQHTLYAKLGQDSPSSPWMEVGREPEITSGRKYFLVFRNKEEECAILRVNLEGTDQYEIHVWNSKVDEERTKCEAEYKKLSGEKQSYQVYTTNCKSATQ